MLGYCRSPYPALRFSRSLWEGPDSRSLQSALPHQIFRMARFCATQILQREGLDIKMRP